MQCPANKGKYAQKSMRTILPLMMAAAFAASPILVHAQATATSSPAASASPAKHHHHDKSLASPAPSAGASVAASPSKKARHKAAAAGSPGAIAAGSPGASASPAKHKWFSLPSASPAAVSPAGNKGGNAPAPNVTPAPGGGNGLVWVNTNTHVFHTQSSRWYGKTKEGKYVSEADALKEGDKAADKGD